MALCWVVVFFSKNATLVRTSQESALPSVCSLLGTRTELWFGHGCSGYRKPQNMNGIMVWACMLWLSETSEDEWSYGLGVDALVIAWMGSGYR